MWAGVCVECRSGGLRAGRQEQGCSGPREHLHWKGSHPIKEEPRTWYSDFLLTPMQTGTGHREMGWIRAGHRWSGWSQGNSSKRKKPEQDGGVGVSERRATVLWGRLIQ